MTTNPAASPRVERSSHAEVEIVLHRIPTPGSKPYIAADGPDRHLWFCESGTSKIGRLDPESGYAFKEFDLPTPNATPIGIVVGADGDLWFAEKTANKIGRITLQGKITEFRCRRRTPVRTP